MPHHSYPPSLITSTAHLFSLLDEAQPVVLVAQRNGGPKEGGGMEAEWRNLIGLLGSQRIALMHCCVCDAGGGGGLWGLFSAVSHIQPCTDGRLAALGGVLQPPRLFSRAVPTDAANYSNYPRCTPATDDALIRDWVENARLHAVASLQKEPSLTDMNRLQR
ncbi:hypothetical protein AOLI_G00053750 [Acnodon oligacanthus]